MPMNAITPAIAIGGDGGYRPYKLTVDDLFALTQAGAFANVGGKVELLDGELYWMNAQRSAHVVAKSELSFQLRLALEAINIELFVLVEATVEADRHYAPEPDIIVSHERRVERFYPVEAAELAVEIADTSLANDLGFKRDLYGKRGVPEYWVVDVQGQRIHQFWTPSADGYGESLVIAFGMPIASQAIGGLVIDTDCLL
jgi:Uma2 family endonuclease